MMTMRKGVALVLGSVLMLSGCGAISEAEDVANNLQGALEDDGDTTDAPVGDESLEGLVAASEGGDYLMEYTLNGEMSTLWFLQVNSVQVNGQSLGFSIIPDPSGLYNFTVAPSGSDMVQGPFSEITAVTGYTPGLIVTPSPEGTTYTWTNPPSQWEMKADKDKRVTYYRMESPEGLFEMDFYYGADITKRVPQAFITAAAEQLTNSGAEFIFGFTTDNFQTWEFSEY